MIRHSKRNGRTYTHIKGLAPFATPVSVQQELDALDDDALIGRLHVGSHIDPFVMAEIMTRGIYYKVRQRREQRKSIVERMLENE